MKKLGSHSELNSPLLRVSSSGCPDSAFETLFRSAVERVSCGVHPTTLHSCCSCAGYMTLSSVFAAWSAWDEFFVGSRSLSTRRERERERGGKREKERKILYYTRRQTDRQTYHQLRRVFAVVAIVRRVFGDGVRQIRGKIVQRLTEQVHLLLTECL